MAIIEIFSKRKAKNEKSGKIDVYIYDQLPLTFRNQVMYLLGDIIGPFSRHIESNQPFLNNNNSTSLWTSIFDSMRRELGYLNLSGYDRNLQSQCIKFLQTASTDNALRIIEIAFKLSCNQHENLKESQWEYHGIRCSAEEAVIELNERFKQHGLGYEFLNGKVIKLNSEYMHNEVIKGCLNLIRQNGFHGAEDEFQKAHVHCRHGRFKEAVAEASKAFESTMKTICDNQKWTYKNANAQTLIDILSKNKLIPNELQSYFSVKSKLTSGLPTIRNKQASHGQGKEVIEVTKETAAFAIHLAASNITFIIANWLAQKNR